MVSTSRRRDMLADISQRLRVMRTQEASSHYVVPDYLAPDWQHELSRETAESEEAECGSSSHSSSPSQINENWREEICDWCYQIVDHYDFSREVVSIAMSYLDRYVAVRTINCYNFQLAAMTAMHLAIKLHEPRKFSMSSLINLSRGYFVVEQMAAMEESMFRSLDWHLHPPTPMAFCRDFTSLLSGDVNHRALHDITQMALFMTELSVCDYWFVTKKPSSIALASLINAFKLLGPKRIDPRCMEGFLHYAVDIGVDIAHDNEVIECSKRLREMYLAGGYDIHLDEGLEENRESTASPTEVIDGPDVDDLNVDDDLSQMESM